MVSSLTRAAAFFSVGVRVAAALVATAAEPALCCQAKVGDESRVNASEIETTA
jgi:hypothetical protein